MTTLTLEEYDRAKHLPMLERWWLFHNNSELQGKLLPKLGVLVLRDGFPVAALFCYLTTDQGIAFPEWPIAAPGQTAAESAEAFEFALAALEVIALGLDYNIFIVNTLLPISRIMRRQGFQFDNTPKITGIKILA